MHNVSAFYVITDGGRARFVRPAEGQHFRTIREFESEHIHDRAHALGRAPLSRVNESASPTRHGIEPREDPRDRAERDFANTIAQTLNADQDVAACDALVLVAPNHTLSELRAGLSTALKQKVATTVAKDITKVPDADLPKHLPQPSPLWRKS